MSYASLALTLAIAPLVGFFLALVGFRNRHGVASGIVVLSAAVTALCAVMLLIDGPQATVSARWFSAGGMDFNFGLLLDGRTLIMGTVVAIITLCILVYSLGYMADDPGRGRFFAFLALFEWAMLSFVYAPNLLQTFIFWELIGLSSFLLIGFWYRKPSAVAAAKKAFIMTRIGDVGLFVGLILLFQTTNTLDIVAINAGFAQDTFTAAMGDTKVEIIAMLLFMGIIGKSAQFPLHTWLPDAMEGPTPVSALLHSATMVAAGVFLFARFDQLFMDAETTRTVVLAIAAFTAILASTMAMVAVDMKKILAYSSISQLGFMLLGLAAGSLFAGFFHLTTHAVFKALLFLCAGAYIHHFATNDIVAMGRAGARSMKVTTLGVIVGGAALAGIPPLAGFFSKEMIIGSLGGEGRTIFLVGAYAASFLTAYYTFRMVFLLICPNEKSAAEVTEPAHAGGHGDHGDDHHDDHGAAPWVMQAPILLLTAGAVALGFFGDRLGHYIGVHDIHHPSIAEMAPAIAVALTGVLAAWLEFGRRAAPQTGFISRAPGLQKLFANRWYLDVIYNRVFVASAKGIASVSYEVETRGLDGGTDKIADTTVDVGGMLSRAQTGRLQLYIGTAVILVALGLLYVELLS